VSSVLQGGGEWPLDEPLQTEPERGAGVEEELRGGALEERAECGQVRHV